MIRNEDLMILRYREKRVKKDRLNYQEEKEAEYIERCNVADT